MAAEINWNGDEVFRQVAAVAENALKQMAQTTSEVAKERTPKDTGNNASTITWDKEGDAFRVYTQSGYGGYLELGTSKMAARPYLFPAFEEAKKELDNNLKGKI